MASTCSHYMFYRKHILKPHMQSVSVSYTHVIPLILVCLLLAGQMTVKMKDMWVFSPFRLKYIVYTTILWYTLSPLACVRLLLQLFPCNSKTGCFGGHNIFKKCWHFDCLLNRLWEKKEFRINETPWITQVVHLSLHKSQNQNMPHFIWHGLAKGSGGRQSPQGTIPSDWDGRSSSLPRRSGCCLTSSCLWLSCPSSSFQPPVVRCLSCGVFCRLFTLAVLSHTYRKEFRFRSAEICGFIWHMF